MDATETGSCARMAPVLYCVYAITGPTGTYVGKTSDIVRRWRAHRRDASKGSLYPLHAAIRECGEEAFSVEVLLVSYDEAQAFGLERRLLAEFRRTGTIVFNLTEGGAGASCVSPKRGRVLTPEQRKALEPVWARNAGRKDTEETRLLKSARLKEWSDLQGPEYLSRKSKKAWSNKVTRDNQSKGLKAYWSGLSPDERKARNSRNKGAPA